NAPCKYTGAVNGTACLPNYDWWDPSTGSVNRNGNYGYRNCTDWVAWFLTESPDGPKIALKYVTGLGNGGDWAGTKGGPTRLPGIQQKLRDDAAAAGVPYEQFVNSTPAVGSAAVQEGDVGHVAYVKALNPTTQQITVSEYNYGTGGVWGAYGERSGS